ncbi:TonB-dependent receptor [Massilibacteroides sp.]|uniref:SusC/RagA family TonB-linked outer membrane protein n=1 Tax=Massilibacteroides sp. TaxID=2034766 RepID=UPI00263092F5|nr:TonB-dependent receptor [Massilibacteroides sp.]MDD4516172.1 TonB-dependent receptor [Massilibacteroides sp.]
MTKLLIHYLKRKHYLLCYAAVFFFLSFSAFSQKTNTVEGTVLDSKTGETIIGASILLTGASIGTVTDLDGTFSLPVKSFPVNLEVSYIGYKEAKITVLDSSQPLIVNLSEGENLLNEVVVIGYGTQKRYELTSAISSVSSDRIQQVTPSVEAILGGAVAGLNVTQTSGQPGAASTIRIRGGNSITGGNEPLYVIDGFIVYNDVTATRTGAGSSDATLNPLASINTNDIESIEVLKDVSATAIYGTRGANGVIIITTKKGRKGSNNINYQVSFGWQTIRKKVEFLNAKQWTELYNEIRIGEGREDDVLPVPDENSGTDWQEAALQTGFTQTHQLSFTGGDEKSRYAISGNYTSQEGIVIGTDLKRYGGRVNLERDVFPKLRIGLNATGSFTQLNGLNNRNENNEPNSWVAAINTPPIISVYKADGSFNYEPNVLTTVTYDGKITNPISDLLNVKALTENTRVLSIFFAEYTVLPELRLKANIGADLNNTKQSNYAPSYTAPGASLNGVASIGQKQVYAWQTEYTLNYNKLFNEIHSVAGLLGFTSQRTDRKAFTAGSYGFSNDATGYNNLRSGETADWPTSASYTSTLNSFLSRVSYSYKEKYNITGTFRADGSSRFAKGHQWGYFPSLGLSWNIDKEDFFNSDKISHLQVRLSGGTVGNQEIGDFRYISNVVPTTYYFNDKASTAYIVENISNSDLKWETTASYNLGANLGLFDDRIRVTADAYYKKTSDLLLEVPVEDVTGFTTAMRNAGSVSNKGLEIEIAAKIIDTKDFRWNANLNWARNINKVESLGNADYFLPSFTGVGTLTYLYPLIVKKGEPLGSFYGYKFAGIVQTDDDISQLPPQTTEALAPGIARYQDVSGPDGVPDGRVTEADRVVLGNSQPKFTGGFNSTFAYKNFDLFIALQGSYGNKLFNSLRARFEKTSTSYNSLATVADRWTPTNPSNTIAKATNSTSIVTDDRFIEDASFLRAKNITLGYSIPVKQITKDAKLRLFVSLQNFFTWTPYTGYDPESNRNGVDESSSLYQGVDFGTYPSAKSVLLGLNITL